LTEERRGEERRGEELSFLFRRFLILEHAL
jgi:hypothetical protein